MRKVLYQTAVVQERSHGFDRARTPLQDLWLPGDVVVSERKRLRIHLERLTLDTAPLLLLYHTRPGRGLTEPILEMLMIEPP